MYDHLQDLFEENEDHGSLPDIFVEKLNPHALHAIYDAVMSITEFSGLDGNFLVWSIQDNKDVPLSSYNNPIAALNLGELAPFRGLLREFQINTTVIPALTMGVARDYVEFDFRRGPEWGPDQVEALFEFLSLIKDAAPSAQIIQANEGCDNTPNAKFTNAFNGYYEQRLARIRPGYT